MINAETADKIRKIAVTVVPRNDATQVSVLAIERKSP